MNQLRSLYTTTLGPRAHIWCWFSSRLKWYCSATDCRWGCSRLLRNQNHKVTLFRIKTLIQPLYHTATMASKLFELTKKLSDLKVNCLIYIRGFQFLVQFGISNVKVPFRFWPIRISLGNQWSRDFELFKISLLVARWTKIETQSRDH